jgi:hypothetical protein
MNDDSTNLRSLLTEYLAAHPGCENPLDNNWVFDEACLIKMIKKSKGRRIVFDYTDNLDDIRYHYEIEKALKPDKSTFKSW